MPVALGSAARARYTVADWRHTDVTEDLSFKPDELPEDRSLVLVDDDRSFVLRLARAMETRGFEVRTAHSVAEARGLSGRRAPALPAADLGLEEGMVLAASAALRVRGPQAART